MITVDQSRSCSPVEAYFCRLVACEGFKPTRAYRIAWKSKANQAHDLAHRVMSRPHVQARIRELQEQADREAMLRRDERRALLADTARRRIREAPSHSERTAAIREDAILAGERVERAQMSAQVDVRAALCALVGSAPPEARTATATSSAGSVAPVEGGGGGYVAPAAPAAVQAATLPALPAWLPAVSVLAPASPAAETFEEE